MNKLKLLLTTLYYLRPGQALMYVIRRALPPRSVGAPTPPGPAGLEGLQQPIAVAGIYVAQYTFRFHNHSHNLRREGFDWCPDGTTRLWRYHLHYFDYLREARRGSDNKKCLIQWWIDANRQNSQPGWEAFTTSLRIVNWIFFFSSAAIRDSVPPAWLCSLYRQALWLEKNDESHILANHYFENMKALLFAGLYFSGADAERWCKKAQRELSRQLREQILDDGGHYERSPQYHCLMLENYLDLYNLASAAGDRVGRGFIDQLRSAAERSLAFLDAILFPGDLIPLFNDSAYGAAPQPASLRAYAARLWGYRRPQPAPVALIDLPDSGLFGLRLHSDMLLIDCGDIGPSYQPGHTHCDFLSYELMLQGEKIIVDTGLFEYEPGAMRRHVRSTRAHNTVVVDGQEQSEIWGEFRVARRAKKLAAAIARDGDGYCFQGEFTGFPAIEGGIRHRRQVEISPLAGGDALERLTVEDRLQAAGRAARAGRRHRLESYIYLAPGLRCRQRAAHAVEICSAGGAIADIRAAAAGGADTELTLSLEAGCHCPEFGKKLHNTVIVLRQTVSLPATLSYTVYIRH